ncbi:MAG: FtsX-like permease family protein, partial [Acidimicrobiia bacterium]|nr:FtsX-like permease family protein [Acidimicrobiia bacterium]
MFKLVRRGIAANLGRLILTLISVVLGVAFVSGSFVLADSLRAIFNQVSEDAFAGIDAQIRAVEPELNSGQDLLRFDGSVLDDITALDEVDYAEGGLFAFEQTYTQDADGNVNRPQGPPVFTSSWGGPSPASGFTLLEGEAPVGQQIAIDRLQADTAGFEIGDLITVSVPTGQPEEFELSGFIDFGEGGAGGAYFNLFDLPTAQRILGVEGNQVDSIVVTATPGTSNADLLAAIGTTLPQGLEVVAAEEVIAEQQEQFGTFIDIFGNVLLGFAVVVLFVSIFIIYNTFAILVGQRTRQLGLLRSIGASAPQIRSMVLIEAVIIGVIASLVGLFGGIGVAWLLKQLFSTGGGSFPDGPLRILPRTVVVVVLVGLVVTVASALLPAIRASLVSPLEAVRDGGRKQRSLRFRIIAGAAVVLPGLALLFYGMFGDIADTTPRLASIGVGAALTFVGVAMLSALFAGPVAATLGIPVEGFKGVTGRLARDNASRNPQRTAATATALMIGLALITGVAVLTESLLRTFDELLEESVAADLFVFEEAQGLPFSGVLVEQLAELPEVDQVAGYTTVDAK